MLWHKEKYNAAIKHGRGSVASRPIHGYIQQLVICPESDDTIWSLNIFDRDGDCIYKVIDHQGQLNDREGIPVGKDQMEIICFDFYGLTRNEIISVILNIKEIV